MPRSKRSNGFRTRGRKREWAEIWPGRQLHTEDEPEQRMSRAAQAARAFLKGLKEDVTKESQRVILTDKVQ